MRAARGCFPTGPSRGCWKTPYADTLGVGYYSACAIGKANPEAAVKPMLPYIGALLLAVVIIAFVPWISLGFLGNAAGQ